MEGIKCLAFDLDGTLAESKQAIPDIMARRLEALLGSYTVAIITGGQHEQVERQVISRLNYPTALEVFSCSGATYKIYGLQGAVDIYDYKIPDVDAWEIKEQIESLAKKFGVWQTLTKSPVFEFRGSQVTYSALGQLALVDEKQAFDPDGSRRKQIIDAFDKAGYVARLGGLTSVDVSLKGYDKAYAIQTLIRSGFDASEIYFVGDQLQPGGNDYPVIATGVNTHKVNNWGETLKWLESF